MVAKNVHIVVDKNFFNNIFENKRKDMEKKLGINLSQTNFTRMINGFKLKVPKQELMNQKKRGKRKNEIFMF